MRTNLMAYAKYLTLTICAVFFWFTPAVPGPYPNHWFGDLELDLTEKYDTPGLKDTTTAKGLLEVAAAPDGVKASGEMELTFTQEQGSCKGRGQSRTSVMYRGPAATLQAVGGAYLAFTSADRIQYVMDWKCLFNRGVRTTPSHKPPLWIDQVPLIDGKTLPLSHSMFSLGVSGTVKLITPCAGWDSSKTPGPRVTFVPDVLTGALPEQDPDPFRTLKSLKELTLEADAAKRTPGQIAIRRSLGDVDIGLTYVPTAATFEKPRIETSRTEPRKRVYGHCLSVDSVEVRLPVEHIKTTIAVEVHRSASCYQYAVAHEAKHYREAWLTMRLIAMGISEHLQTKYPGPANALPAPTNLLSLYYSNIQSEIASIVRQELTASKTRHLEFDEQRRTGAAACAEFQGAAER